MEKRFELRRSLIVDEEIEGLGGDRHFAGGF